VAAWPNPDLDWNPLVAEWFELVGAAHPRPSPAVAAVAGRWATEFNDWIKAGRDVPIAMLHEAEEATGAPREIIREAARRRGMRGKLLYWQRVYGQPYPGTRVIQLPMAVGGQLHRRSSATDAASDSGRPVSQRPGAPLRSFTTSRAS
jgi:hypothetical protein